MSSGDVVVNDVDDSSRSVCIIVGADCDVWATILPISEVEVSFTLVSSEELFPALESALSTCEGPFDKLIES